MHNFIRRISGLSPQIKGNIINRQVASQLRALLFIALVICAGVLLQILVFLDQKALHAKREYEANLRQFHYWSGVASQFPNIPDILYNASVSALNVGKTTDALHYIDQAIQIDPLFKDARELKHLIVRG